MEKRNTRTTEKEIQSSIISAQESKSDSSVENNLEDPSNGMLYLFDEPTPIQDLELRESSLDKAVLHWKASGVGEELKKTRICEFSGRYEKKPFSLMYMIRPWAYPPGLNSSIATYLDINSRLLIIVGFLVLGNLLLMYQTRQSYCKYLSVKFEGKRCEEQLTLYSFLVDSWTLEHNLKKDIKKLEDLFASIKFGILVSNLTIWALPFLFFWLFKKHLEFALRIKSSSSSQVKRIENFSLMLTDFIDPNDLRRDFEADFESLIQENGFTGECKILKSVYTTHRVRVQVLREEVEQIEEELESLRSMFRTYSDLNQYTKPVKRIQLRMRKKELELKLLRKKIVRKQSEIDSSYLLSSCVYFVTLSSSLSRDKILRSFKDKYHNRGLFSILFRLCRGKMPKYRISEAPQPSNINWKNFGIHRVWIFTIRVISYFLISVILLFVILSLFFIVNHMQSNRGYSPGDAEQIKKLVDGSTGFYIFFEVYQFIATFVTKIVCNLFDIDFTKIQLIFSQGLSLGLLKVTSLLPFKKMLIIYPDQHSGVAFLVEIFQVILTQSLLKPIMKVFSFGNVVSFLRMTWIRVRFCFGYKPLLTQQELNRIFSKPKCQLENLYCEDIYITIIAVVSSPFNPGATVACLFYFIVKTFADRFLFLRFYAELEVDSIELSKRYFRLLRFAITWVTLEFILKVKSYFDFAEPVYADYAWEIDIMRVLYVVTLFLPFEVIIFYISASVEKSDLVRRTENEEDFLVVEEDGVSLAENGKSLFQNREYYKGVGDLASIRETAVSPSRLEVSLMGGNDDQHE